MTEVEVREAIKDIPIGSRLQLIRNNGDILEVRLASHEVSGTEEKDYGNIVVPALPPALIVQGVARFGNHRIEIEDLIKVSWIETD